MLIALSGLFFGYILTLIAQEELSFGKKYFILVKRLIFLIITLVVLIFFWRNWMYFSLFLIVSMSVFSLQLNYAYWWMELLNYSLLMGSYLVMEFIVDADISSKLLIASLIFLYGLPAGTLIFSKLLQTNSSHKSKKNKSHREK